MTNPNGFEATDFEVEAEKLPASALEYLAANARDCGRIAFEILIKRGDLIPMFPGREQDYRSRIETKSSPIVGIYTRKPGISPPTKPAL